MQTNRLLQCSQAKTQSAVNCPPLRFALLFFFFVYHHTVAPYRNNLAGHEAPSARDKPLNQYLSLDKRCQEFSLFGGSEALFEGA